MSPTSFPITPQDRVEALLHLLCEELFDAEDEVRTLACQSIDRAADMSVPLQYLICRLDLPAARAALRATLPDWAAALQRLDALLAQTETVWAGDRRGWAGFSSLLSAPWPVRRPNQADLRDHDVLLILERDARFGGSWDAQLEWLHQRGSRQNQPDIRRILQLAAFEREQRVNVRDVLTGGQAEPDAVSSKE